MSHIVPRLLQTDKNDPMFSLNSPHLTSVDGAFVGVQDIAGAATRQAFWCSHSFPTMSWVSYIDELSAGRETLCNGDLRSYHNRVRLVWLCLSALCDEGPFVNVKSLKNVWLGSLGVVA